MDDIEMFCAQLLHEREMRNMALERAIQYAAIRPNGMHDYPSAVTENAGRFFKFLNEEGLVDWQEALT